MNTDLILPLGDFNPQFIWPSLALMGVLLVGAIIIALTDRWRRRSVPQEALSANDQLSRFRILYEQGVLSKEEFDLIRARLGGEIRKALEAAPKPEAPAPSKDSLTLPESKNGIHLPESGDAK